MTDRDELITILQIAQEVLKADGCTGCAYQNIKDWEMPCNECKRSKKDYWEWGEYE